MKFSNIHSFRHILGFWNTVPADLRENYCTLIQKTKGTSFLSQIQKSSTKTYATSYKKELYSMNTNDLIQENKIGSIY
jgi:hypothetical protein